MAWRSMDLTSVDLRCAKSFLGIKPQHRAGDLRLKRDQKNWRPVFRPIMASSPVEFKRCYSLGGRTVWSPHCLIGQAQEGGCRKTLQ
jgi:hypothetical protein